jgi:hypothetical protein
MSGSVFTGHPTAVQGKARGVAGQRKKIAVAKNCTGIGARSMQPRYPIPVFIKYFGLVVDFNAAKVSPRLPYAFLPDVEAGR